ncbi:MAG TPA: aminotransferase class IV family protein [Saprospiraceae bacterium]
MKSCRWMEFSPAAIVEVLGLILRSVFLHPVHRFLETICIFNGQPRNLEWHQRRVDATLNHFSPKGIEEENSFPLADILSACDFPTEGLYRCRIRYDLNSIEVEFFPYTPRQIRSLRLIEAPGDFDYSYKYADRKVLEELFAQREDADDILIVRDGWITDTSIANIAFRKGERWYTPSRPLLAGTTLKRLITKGILIPRPIHQSELHHFESFRIFNAMNDWGGEEQEVGFIIGG